MSWGTALLIALIWIVGTIILYIVLHVLDIFFKFQDHTGWTDLGRAISNLFITFFPPAFLLLIVLLMKIEKSSPVLFILVAVVLIFGLPAYIIITKALNPPEKVASYCMNSVGDYEKFRNSYKIEYGEKLKREVSEHEITANYIEWQLNFIYKKLKVAFKYTKIAKKSVYIDAVMKKNKEIFQDISSWEILDHVHPGIWFLKSLLIDYTDGDRSILNLTYNLSHDKKLATYIRDNNSNGIRNALLWKYFKDITMTGRLCYDFMCIERYLLTLYPEADWSKITYMWRITKNNGFGWSDWSDIVKKAAVNALIDYEDKMAGKIDMSPKARKNRMNELTGIIGSVQRAAENVIHNEKYNESFSIYEETSIETINRVQSYLIRKNIPVPDMSLVECFRFDRSTVRQNGENKEAWGYDVDTEGLSLIKDSQSS